ncbi:DUF6783 domain-containing protein [Blautia sp. HCP3S3_H10_1]
MCKKNHSSNLHASLCERFCLISVGVAHYINLVTVLSGG